MYRFDKFSKTPLSLQKIYMNTNHLASIYGTESDVNNCSFYHKVGACKHGSGCSKSHIKPIFSNIVLLSNLLSTTKDIPIEKCFEDIFCELSIKYGQIEDMIIAANRSSHLKGSVYVKFVDDRSAEAAVNDLNNRFYDDKPIFTELSPVDNLRDAVCRSFTQGRCNRPDTCNFVHTELISRSVTANLYNRQRVYFKH